MTPNLNKWKFVKLHRKRRAINLGKGNKGKQLAVHNFGIKLIDNFLLTINQLEAFKKFVNKRLKAKEKKNRRTQKLTTIKKKSKKRNKLKIKEKTLIIRRNFNLGLTKKPLQVRMGKGKGAPVDWVYPYSKNRILLEFLVKKFKFSKLSRVFNKASNKLPTKLKLVKKKIKKTKLNLILKCVREL